MIKIFFAGISLVVLPVNAQETAAIQTGSIDYTISFQNAAQHEAEITATFRNIGNAPLDLRMSRSSPGRYALHEFAKNVYAVSAVDGAGKTIELSRRDPYSWQVADHDGTVTITYTLYANHADGTYSQIDPTHAHLNMPATFIWATGFETNPINLNITPLNRSWRAATQLRGTRNSMIFRAPNLQYFLDSPTELSDFDTREWTIGTSGNRQTIRLSVHHDGEASDLDIYAAKAKRVVDEQIKIFGEAPKFDHDTYTFIADYLPHVTGDGMEHRNSTILTRSSSLFEDDFAQLGTLSHEFFHAWNVERLRPAELEPFNFSNTNPTTSLWFAEGFTSYYGPLAIRRAGESSFEGFAKELAGRLNYVLNSPGRNFYSPQGMSLRAAFTDAARAVDPTNNENIFVSYYSYGAMIALALDLTLRQRFEDVTLDDYMRQLWATHGKPEIPYTHDDLRVTLATVTDDTDFAKTFFAEHIESSALPDYAPLLDQAGLKLQPANPDHAWLDNAKLEQGAKAMIIAKNTAIGSPLYKAGLGMGDEITRIGRFKIHDQDDWDRAIERHEPGDKVMISFRQRSVERKSEITFSADPKLEIVLFEDADMELTKKQRTFRESWLGLEQEDTDQ